MVRFIEFLVLLIFAVWFIMNDDPDKYAKLSIVMYTVVFVALWLIVVSYLTYPKDNDASSK